MKTGTKVFLCLIALIIILATIAAITRSSKNATPSPKEVFAQCLTDKGVKFYGAYWCPHCSAQKRAFGSAIKKVDYIECSTPDGKGQMPVCAEAGIQGYPTWVFPDGTRLSGEQSFATLAEKSGCVAPAE